MIVLTMLAQAKSGEGVKSGPIGLAVILVLCIAAYFLFKSMSKHLKRVRDDFPTDTSQHRTTEQPTEQGQAAAPPAARADPDGGGEDADAGFA